MAAEPKKRILHWWYFSFKASTISFHSIPICMFSQEAFSVIVFLASVSVRSFFSSFFQDFLYVFGFLQFTLWPQLSDESRKSHWFSICSEGFLWRWEWWLSSTLYVRAKASLCLYHCWLKNYFIFLKLSKYYYDIIML